MKSIIRDISRLPAICRCMALGCLCAVLFGGVFASCETDNYETGDHAYSEARADFGLLYVGNSGQIASFMTDDGDSLLLETTVNYKWATKTDSAYRALVYYKKVGGKAHFLSATSIPVPEIHAIWSLKDPKTDPVNVESMWMSGSRRYVNMSLLLLSGTTSSQNDKHTLGMMCDTLMQNADGHSHLHLRLYHAQNDVPEYYSSRVYMSIPLQKGPYRLDTGDTVSVAVNTYDGEVVRRFVY